MVGCVTSNKGYIAMPPDYNFSINHPVQTGWLAHGRDIYDTTHEAMLTERFRDTNENIQSLLAAVALTGSIADAKRMSHEHQSRGELGLGKDHLFHAYTEFAGRPKRVGKFIAWFSTIAQACFEKEDIRKDLQKIGLELGGMRQAGDWSGTTPLDDMAKSIPVELACEDPSAQVRVLERGRAVQKNYVLQPLEHINEGMYNPDFHYAMVRRRRGVADILIPGKHPIEIFKESAALVIIDQMSEKEALVIREAYKDQANFAVNGQKNSGPAGAAGREFERAIQELRNESRSVVPVSAHYVMNMRIAT